MIDREKVLTVLERRFPDAPRAERAAAANAIVGLDDDWEDVTDRQDQFGYNFSAQCCSTERAGTTTAGIPAKSSQSSPVTFSSGSRISSPTPRST